MPISQGIAKQLRIKRQTTKGVLAGVTGGQIMRRNSSTFALKKEAYTTESEMTSRRQILSSRHGTRSVDGKLNGIFSPGTYSDIFAALLMRDFTVIAPVTGVAITIAGTGPYTLTRDAGSWLVSGFKIGTAARLTAGAFSTTNLNSNMVVIGVTALVLTVTTPNRATLIPEGPIAAATVTVPGKMTFVPETGHTNVYYTTEEFYPDQPFSERCLDVKFTQAAISMPGSGNSTIDFTAMGLDQTQDTSAYFTAPTLETTSDALIGAGGSLIVGGVTQANVTDFSMTIDGTGNMADASVGKNVRSDIFMGKLKVSGSLTSYFESIALANNFLNEIRTSIVLAATAGSLPNAEAVVFSMANVDMSSSDPDDAETGLKRTYNFTAVFNAGGGAILSTHATTLAIQDTMA